MFSIEFLHAIRRHEIALVERHLEPGARILEIGGGTGFQAKLLAERDFDVSSIDVPQSNYAGERVFPVIDYDGETIPFPDGSFDVVFSSNVLEHIRDLERLHAEVRRVLKPGGYCLHAMPTGVWSFWTIVTHYLMAAQRLRKELRAGGTPGGSLAGKPEGPAAAGEAMQRAKRTLAVVLRRAVSLVRRVPTIVSMLRPPRHGEFGNAFTEIVTFSRPWWVSHFRRNGFAVLSAEPMGLFYTGYMLMAARWPLSARERCARWLGSACVLYRLQPTSRQDRT
jgi:SAM-dependent methyltransferase